MLVLARRKGETLILTGEMVKGEEIAITIVDTASRRAKVAIEAPDGIHVRRGELEPEAYADWRDKRES